MPKHLFPEPSTGPYEVVAQPSSSVVLRNVETKELVDQCRPIPLDQIVAGPSRAQVHFEPDSEVRAVSTTLKGEGGEPSPVRGSAKAGRRKGWGPLAQGAHVVYQTKVTGPERRNLTVGRVLINHREEMRLTVQPYKGVWKQVRVVRIPQFQTRNGHSSVGTDLAKETSDIKL